MRNFKLLMGVLLAFTFVFQAYAQDTKQTRHENLHRCSTMEELEKQIQNDPKLPEKWRIEGEKRYNAYLQSRQGSQEREQAGEIIIPVVFHIVGAAVDVNAIPDRDAYEQIEILNRDYYGQKALLYSGLFPKSIENTVGKITTIKFVLARRTPAGTLTTGIERRITTQTFTANTISTLKHTSTGGLDAWDNDKYLNVWCCSFTDGLLGIATFPFSTTPATANEQGVCIGLYTLGANTCRNYYPNYPDGATLSHEVGHYFYLWHTFGDQAGCNNLDFRLQTGWPLPAPALVDDTPPEQTNDATRFGNPSENYSDGCAGPDGIAYGSFMNYYDDRALFMFTEGHKQRVLATLNLYRPGLLTSLGATPPIPVSDAYLVNINPRGKCDTRMPMVPGTPLTATIRNFGTTALTSVSVNVKVDALAAITTNVPLTLASGNDTTITIGTAPAAVGNHTVVVYTTAPNGGTDNFLNNDTLTSYIYVQTTNITAPFTENFSSTTFPPPNWLINNPQSTTWIRNTTAGFNAAGSATVQNYSYNGPGQLDELITPPIDFGANDSALLSFKVAYRSYSENVYEWDGLEVHVSVDGGRTYRMLYKKTGHALRTVPGVSGNVSFNPLVNQALWRSDAINLTPYIAAGQKVIIKFRNTNAYGNNLYLDDISVTAAQLVRRDITPINFVNLPAFICPGAVLPVPSITVFNRGLDTLKTFNINYTVDNGTVIIVPATTNIARGQNANFVLGTLNLGALASGTHTIKVYTSLPNGLADQAPANDTISASFLVYLKQAAPLVEGFEGPTFPPTGWTIKNPDNAITWTKNTVAGRNSLSSAYSNNFNYAAPGATDDLLTPAITFNSGIDSVSLAFDVAALTYNYPGSTAIPLDTLQVLATTDCGVTYTSIYKKWGNELQTINDPNYPQLSEFIPNARNQWRNELIDLSSFRNSAFLQIVFRNRNNYENNVFIDNINLSTKTLPAQLKAQGYLIYPSPFTTSFTIQHYITPTELRGVAVYNSVGQRVYAQSYGAGGASSFMQVDMSRLASGLYTVVLNYTNRTISQKIIKSR